MPNANDAASPPPELTRELQPDYNRFEALLSRSALGPTLPPGSRELFGRFGALVCAEAERLSLVARGDRQILFTRHILDSLNPATLFTEPPGSALDVGSGGGFPGIPLAILWPKAGVTLLEAREKKAGFLERVVRELGLPNVRVVCARLEDYGRSWIAPPHAAVFIRGVGDLPATLESAARAAQPGADWVYFMGGEADAPKLIASVRRLGPSARVREGALGGTLLTGQFADPAAPPDEQSDEPR